MTPGPNMVRALRLGETGFALVRFELHHVPMQDGTIAIGVVAVGARDNALVDNAPRAAMMFELCRIPAEDIGRALAAADAAARPALDG